MLERATIYQASQRLGISESAVRQRIHRGTLESGKDENGRLVVYLPNNDSIDTKDNDDITTVVENYINALKSQIETLEVDKEHLREESARKDHIIMSLTQRIPAIEAPADEPSNERKSPVSDSEDEGKGDVPPEPAADEIRQSWWRRLFGG